MKTAKFLFTAALAYAGISALYAAPEVVVKTNKPDAIYRCGEEIVITAQVVDNGKAVPGRTVKYDFIADGGFTKKGSFVTTNEPFTWKTKLDLPGSLRTEFILLDENGKPIPLKRRRDQWWCVSGRIGAVAEPENIRPGFKRPADFNEYWSKQRKMLDAIPVKANMKNKVHEDSTCIVYDVKVDCLGKPVSGYLAIPKGKKGKYPARISYHGAGVGSAHKPSVITKARRGFISFDVNAHGIDNNKPREYYSNLYKTDLKEYYWKVYENRETNYFHGMIHRIMRSIDYIKTLPEWDGKNIIVEGASQGGYQAVIAAGVDPAVSICRAAVPAFADFHGEFFSNPKRMPRMHLAGALRKTGKGIDYIKACLDEYAYLDPVSFAGNIKCPTFISVGFCDLSCPPTSVYSIFNAIPAGTRKEIFSYPEGIHATSTKMPGADAYEATVGEK